MSDTKVCGFCKGKPVGNAASWPDGKPRPPAPCPRCGEVNYDEACIPIARPEKVTFAVASILGEPDATVEPVSYVREDLLVAEVERLKAAVYFSYERGYRDAAHGRPLDTAKQAADLIAPSREGKRA